MKPCAVKWCCAMEVEDEYCAVHRKYPKLHPEEKPHRGEGPACAACRGTGECVECDGWGEIECVCGSCGHEHEDDCADCRGTGDCRLCVGTGAGQKSEVA